MLIVAFCRRAIAVIARAVVLARGRVIDARLLAPWLDAGPSASHVEAAIETKPAATASVAAESVAGPGGSSPCLGPIIPRERIPLLEEIERQAIVETLERFRGHRQKTAEALGIGVRTLGLKLKKWKEDQLVAVDL